jgi:hypothetical protein
MSKVQKWIDWVVKLATLLVAAPATWRVAGEAFQGVIVFQVAAVVLVEGVLLSNWLLLDSRRSESPEVKLRYAVTVAVMYAAMLWIAVRDGEGMSGLIFRLSFGLAVAGATWDTFAYTLQKLRRDRVESGVSVDWRVRWHRERLERDQARAALDSGYRVSLAEIAGGEAVKLAQVAARRELGLKLIESQKTSVQGENRYPLSIPPVSKSQLIPGGNGQSVSARGVVISADTGG